MARKPPPTSAAPSAPATAPQVGVAWEKPAAPEGAAQNVWLAGLGALASAQAEGSRAFEALVKQGLEMQNQAQQLARERMGAITDTGTAAPWGRLGGIFEDRVGRALASMGMPSAQDLAALTARVEALENALRTSATAPVKTGAARKSAAPRRKAG